MLRPRETGGEPDLEAFWRGVGERRGGEVSFYSFATYLGRAPTRVAPVGARAGPDAEGPGRPPRRALERLPQALPGLLYLVGERFWFEDFERDNWLLRLIPSRRPFAKTELGFDRSEVGLLRIISRSSAYGCIAGRTPREATRALGKVARFFSTPVVQLDLRSGTTLFFEVMRQEELARLIG